MAEPTYTETVWANTPATTSPIDADNLNHIEQGVSDAIARATSSIRYDTAQGLTTPQQAIARGNLALGDMSTRAATEFGPSAYPSYVGTRTKTFDPRSSLYNGTAANLRAFRTLTSSVRQGGTVKFSVIGASHESGTGATGVLSWPMQLLALLGAAGCPIRGTGLAMAGQGVSDSRWSSTGTTFSFGHSIQINAAATRQFISDQPGPTTEIRFRRNAGAFSITVDGSAPASGNVTVTGGSYSSGTITPDGALSLGLVTVSSLPDTTHTVLMTGVGTAIILGVNVHRSVGVQVTNAGYGGSASADWTTTGYTTRFEGATVETPDAIFVNLGANDAAASVSIATFKANLTTVATNAKAIAPTMLIADFNRSTITAAVWQTYVSAIYDVADTLDLPVLDIMHRWGSYDIVNAWGLMADTIHPNEKGYADWAQAVMAALQLGGGGGGIASVTLAVLPAGSAFYVQKNGANWEWPRGVTITSRPSARTDIKMVSVSTDGTVPSFAIAGWDEAETVPS